MEHKRRVTKPQPKRKRVQSKTDCGAFDSSAIFNMSQTITNSSGGNVMPTVNFASSQDANPFSIMSQHYPSQHASHTGMNLYPLLLHRSAVPPPWMSDLINKIDNLLLRMNSVDEIKSSVISIDSKLTKMGSVVDGLVKRVEVVENSQQFISAGFEQNKSDMAVIADDITSLRVVNRSMVDQLEQLQCENLRDNLMFFGIEEEEGEDSSAFRMGKKFVSKSTRIVRKPRPIIVKFIKRQQRDTVRQNSRKLKESTISISEQFPKAIHEKRKLLFPVYKKAKEAGKQVSFNKDKLFIDGEQTVVKSNELVKITRRDQSGDRMSDTSSGPGFSVAKKTPSVSSIKPSKSSVSDGSSSGSRFEVLADMHTGPD
ncbi:Hypothetical predicted protein [Mytilus galloprovincialis]|uniref:Uncharacterized protein n=1 Tax=Mytilus galloprovincialis TaxID=29158 RepID=A0A8B6D9I9_MYTGA|nr:Hypothetical predicted protein [Mytilus galloprovincialis]